MDKKQECDVVEKTAILACLISRKKKNLGIPREKTILYAAKQQVGLNEPAA
jgi:hypothetical protein